VLTFPVRWRITRVPQVRHGAEGIRLFCFPYLFLRTLHLNFFSFCVHNLVLFLSSHYLSLSLSTVPLPIARWPVRMKEWIHYSPLHSPPNWDKMDWKAQRICMNESLSFVVVYVSHFSYQIVVGASTVRPFHLHP